MEKGIRKGFDASNKAKLIISDHIAGMMQAGCGHPEDEKELYETMVEECAYILTTQLIEGKLSPMEYNATRNALSNILWDVFAKYYTE